MSTNKHYVKSREKTLRCYNLPTTDARGRRLSIHLARNETSRPLTQAEFDCTEVQNGLNSKSLLNVTKQMSK